MRNSTILLPALALAACASSPAYRPPAVEVPPAFREAKTDTGLVVTPPPAVPSAQPVAPAESAAGLTRFWHPLSDTTLNRLMNEVLRASPDVHAAEARLRGARAARLESA